MFCIKCGKPAVAGNFCEKCFLEKENLFSIEDFTINVCSDCGQIDVENEIRGRVVSKNKITKYSVKMKRVGKMIKAVVECSGYIKPLKGIVTQKKNVTMTMTKRKCENCIKILGGYYEASFQVRGDKQDYILNKIRTLVPSGSVCSVIKLKEGYDVRIVDKKTASKVLKSLRDYCDVTASYKLVGKKKGKELYRNFYALR